MPEPPSPLPWWTPTRHADRRPFLTARGRIKAAIRAWFEAEGFTEVDTACLQVSPGNETHLHAFRTELVGTDLARHPLYLHTSPEFACKKLLAAGETRIFTFAPVFRNRERGPLHHPEFTMLEWYRAGATYDVVMDDCAQILRTAATSAATNTAAFEWGGRTCDPALAPKRISLASAVLEACGIDVLARVEGDTGDAARLAAAAEASGIHCAADDTWSDVLSRIIVNVQPQLGIGRAALLTEYPAPAAALARICPRDRRVAERFELYACGVELANGFGELTDPGLQRRRFQIEMAEKARIYGEEYPLDEDFLDALAQMPQASGCALGFDRLVMLATGARTIEQVIWTPLPEPDKENP